MGSNPSNKKTILVGLSTLGCRVEHCPCHQAAAEARQHQPHGNLSRTCLGLEQSQGKENGVIPHRGTEKLGDLFRQSYCSVLPTTVWESHMCHPTIQRLGCLPYWSLWLFSSQLIPKLCLLQLPAALWLLPSHHILQAAVGSVLWQAGSMEWERLKRRLISLSMSKCPDSGGWMSYNSPRCQ